MNYNDLNNNDTLEIIKGNALKFESLIRKYYIERVKQFHEKNFNENPSPYRFYYEEKCSVVALIFPEEFDYARSISLIFLSTPEKREVFTYIVTEEDLQNVDTYSNYPHFKNDKILPSLGYSASQILYEEIQYLDIDLRRDLSRKEYDIEHVELVFGRNLKRYMIDSVREDVAKYKEIDQTPISYFAQNATQFPFSIIDLNPIMEIVDDVDFTYQLEEAMAAYRQNLYLASAATLGVCLETVCIKVCELNEIRIKKGDTQLGKLMELLYANEETRVITRRDNGRLEIAYKMRNLASHSTPGAVLKGDCHFMLQVIQDIANNYLK